MQSSLLGMATASEASSDVAAVDAGERRQLQDKLHELQIKKAKMDELLGELQSLRIYRRDNSEL